ncbi:V-type ATP synthase subunit K [bacterium]|nr:V-type ATP synthase subunit K [bacterium]
MSLGMMFSLLGAIIVSTISGIGSAIGISISGSAANGLLSEEPEKFGKSLILVALPGTQGIYGLVSGVVILIVLGLFGGEVKDPSTMQGLAILGVGIFESLVLWWSGIFQGKTCAAGMGIVAKNPEHAMKGVVNGVMVETYAVFGFLAASLILFIAIAPGLK